MIFWRLFQGTIPAGGMASTLLYTGPLNMGISDLSGCSGFGYMALQSSVSRIFLAACDSSLTVWKNKLVL